MADEKGSIVLPTLLTGAAIYFGLSKQSNQLGDLTREAVSRMIDDQTGTKRPQQPTRAMLDKPKNKNRNRNRSRNAQNPNSKK